jgi:AcrR family transcriptional regulator
MSGKTTKLNAKDRIIAAAGEVFAERGFRDTTIRQITAQAGVNVAAVNYYFRDKEELYHCVLREAKCQCGNVLVDGLPGTAEERLRDFIFRFVHNLLDPKRPDWHLRVVTQEMINPTPALEMLTKEMTGPVFHRLCDLIDEIVPKKLTVSELHLLAGSVLGQCLFHRRSRPMIELLSPELCRGGDRIEQIGRIAAHISDFTLAALHGISGPTPSRTTLNPARRPRLRAKTPSRV